MAKPTLSVEREQIIAALRDGQSLGTVARSFGRSKGTISRIAKQAGFDFDRSQTRKATAALRDYTIARRVELLSEFFTVAQAMLVDLKSPQEFQQLTTAFAILIDKRRLEDGEATSRSEVHDHDSARQQLTQRLD